MTDATPNMSEPMKFSVGDLRAFASKIILDLQAAGLPFDDPHYWANTVYKSLVEILPKDAKPPDDHSFLWFCTKCGIAGSNADRKSAQAYHDTGSCRYAVIEVY